MAQRESTKPPKRGTVIALTDRAIAVLDKTAGVGAVTGGGAVSGSRKALGDVGDGQDMAAIYAKEINGKPVPKPGFTPRTRDALSSELPQSIHFKALRPASILRNISGLLRFLPSVSALTLPGKFYLGIP